MLEQLPLPCPGSLGANAELLKRAGDRQAAAQSLCSVA
jgi:hypothetical protein